MLGGFIERMAGMGLITPDRRTEKYVRQLAELPERDELAPEPGAERR